MPAAASPTVAPPSALPRAPGWRDRLRGARARRRGVEVGSGVVLDPGVRFDLGAGARVVIEDGAVVGERCRFHVAPGVVVRVGAGAVLGARCAIVAHAGIEIGARAMLADEVVLVDVDQRFEDVEQPVRLQRLEAAPVVVGAGARLGPGAVVLRSVTVGDGAAVGAHAVVTHDVAPGAAVDGVPAGTAAEVAARATAQRRRTRSTAAPPPSRHP